MIFENHKELAERIEALAKRRVHGEVPIYEDTSNYMTILGGSVIRLEGNDYFVMGDTREGRFGIDDQPKFWVKRAVDLTTGGQKIIKLVFYEQFTTNMGGITVRCNRNPHKESAVLDLVRGNPRFMQGFTIIDPVGNPVRIIDFIRGQTLFNHVATMKQPHEAYFHETLPGIMAELVQCIEALAGVHRDGQHHGDVRNDHIIINRDSGAYTWIDFDYEVNFTDYDIWSMGNLITFVVAEGIRTFRRVESNPEEFPHFQGVFDEHDAIALYRYRIANLRKIYPYIPSQLNQLLMRFSVGAIDFYEDLESQARDLREIFNL